MEEIELKILSIRNTFPFSFFSFFFEGEALGRRPDVVVQATRTPGRQQGPLGCVHTPEARPQGEDMQGFPQRFPLLVLPEFLDAENPRKKKRNKSSGFRWLKSNVGQDLWRDLGQDLGHESWSWTTWSNILLPGDLQGFRSFPSRPSTPTVPKGLRFSQGPQLGFSRGSTPISTLGFISSSSQ